MYLPSLHDLVSQGDIFKELTYRYVYQELSASEPVIKSRQISAMLLSADCEYDKTPFVYLGEILPLSEIMPSTQGNVRTFRVRSMFPLDSFDNVLPESYVDFRRIHRLNKHVIESSAGEGKRVLSLTDDAQLALQQHLSIFFGFGREEKHAQGQI